MYLYIDIITYSLPHLQSEFRELLGSAIQRQIEKQLNNHFSLTKEVQSNDIDSMTAICDINLTFVTEKAMGYVPWEATLKVRPGTPTAGSQGLNDFRFQTAS